MSWTILGVHLSASTLATGAIEGMGYALLAVGLLIVYRAVRVLNFAHAQVGVLGAVVAAKLVLDLGVPYWLGVVAGVAAGALVSFLFHRFVVLPMSGSPRVVLLVATLGLSQVVVAGADIIPPVVHAGAYPSAWDARFDLGGIRLTGADLTMLIALAAIGIGLTVFLARSRFGLALLASSDNADAARLAGIPVHRIGAWAFTAVGGLAAFTVILFSPVQGVSAGTGVSGQGTSMLLMAFIAAMAGGFWSLPRAAVAGVLLGILQAVLYVVMPAPGDVPALMFVVLVVVVIATARRSRLAADGAAIAPPTPPAPRAVDLSSWARRVDVTAVVLVLAVAAAAPLVLGTAASQLTLVQILCYALAALSVVVLTGWTGQISLGQFAFVGIGAYLTALLLGDGWNMFAAIAVSTAIGAIGAGLLGIPALRARGMYLAVLTLGFGIAVQSWLLPGPLVNPTGATLISAFPQPVLGISFGDPLPLYYVALAVLALVMLGLTGLARRRTGRLLRAVRDNEAAAASFGISGVAQKLKAFTLAGALAALAGSLWGIGLGTFQASQFSPDSSISLVFMVVIGGIATLGGPVIASVATIGLPLVLGIFIDSLATSLQELTNLLGGLGVLLVLRKDPAGIGADLQARRRRLIERLARRRGEEPVGAAAVAASSAMPAPPPAAGGGEGKAAPALEVDDVTVRFGGVVADDRVGFILQPGTVTGLIGANGAGKTSLVHAIAGSVETAGGRVRLGGVDITRRAPHRRARLGLARTFQNGRLFDGLTVSETLAMSTGPSRASLLADLLGLPGARRRDREARSAADELARSFGLGDWLDHLVGELSTGTRRVVDIAGVIARRPRVVLLDEPAAGLAQREVERFAPLIERIRRETGAAILLIEHDLPFVMAASSRVVAMAEGRVVADGDPASVRTDPAVIASYLGVDDRVIQRSRSAAPTPAAGPDASFELLWWVGCPSHERAHRMLAEAMERFGWDPGAIRSRQVLTQEEAADLGFLGSPTIRIDGHDIVPEDGEPALTCRLYFRRDGRPSPLPDPAALEEALAALRTPV